MKKHTKASLEKFHKDIERLIPEKKRIQFLGTMLTQGWIFSQFLSKAFEFMEIDAQTLYAAAIFMQMAACLEAQECDISLSKSIESKDITFSGFSTDEKLLMSVKQMVQYLKDKGIEI